MIASGFSNPPPCIEKSRCPTRRRAASRRRATRRPRRSSTKGSASRLLALPDLRLPRLAVRVPADQDVGGDEERDPLEQGVVDATVGLELADHGAAVDDRDARALRLVRIARARAERQGSLFEERDPRPRDVGLLGQGAYRRAQDLVGLGVALENASERLQG